MSIGSLRDNIKTALQTIASLKEVYDTAPEQPRTPCAIIRPVSGSYDMAGSAAIWQPSFDVVILVARGGRLDEIADLLDGYIEPTGATSVKAAIDAGTYSGNADVVRVMGFSDYGGLSYNGEIYLGVRFQVEAII